MLSSSDFIETYADALTAETGRGGGGVHPELKHSRDLQITGRADWADVEQGLNVAVYGGLLAYLRRYPQVSIAPLMLRRFHPTSSGPTFSFVRYAPQS